MSQQPTLEEMLESLRAQKDGAYAERNQCVALLARMAVALGMRAGVRLHPADDAAWEADWRTIVAIDLPTGQVTWHFHDSEGHLLAGLPSFPGEWDGHTTPEKYRRVNAAFRAPDVAAEPICTPAQIANGTCER